MLSSKAVSPPSISKKLPEQGVTAPGWGQETEAPAGSDSSIQSKKVSLEERLSKMEEEIRRLADIEKGMADAQALSREVQALMKCIQELNTEVKNISTKLQGTLGYDIYHSFKCEKCGSHRLVAAAFRCTSCGKQGWRGWWPR